MTLSKREQLMVAVTVLFLIAVFFYISQPSSRPKGVTGPLLPKDQADQKRAVAIRTLKQMSDDQDKIGPRLNDTTYNLPAERVQPLVVRELQKFAAQAGVHLREYKPLPPHALKSARGARVPLEIHFRAAFQPNVVKFLYYLEDPKGKIVVDKINVTSAEAKLNAVDVTAQITVFTRSLQGVTETDTGDTSDATTNSKS